ncbi:hypothetical protein V1498_17000 [Peribacillus sp. SCS-26]
MTAKSEKITLHDINEMLEKLDLLLDEAKLDYPETYEEAVSSY